MAVIIAASAAKSVFAVISASAAKSVFALFCPVFASVFLPGSRNPAGGFYFNIFTASDIREVIKIWTSC